MSVESTWLLENVVCGMQSGVSKGLDYLRCPRHPCVATCAYIYPWASRDRVGHLTWQDVVGRGRLRPCMEEMSTSQKGYL